ncbi:MAG TPA: hypothetical protein VMH89_02225 [Candidatus Acidoferrum sp.]|nr:hypothetical protein [Candidatus Acidoferrum sp.]
MVQDAATQWDLTSAPPTLLTADRFFMLLMLATLCLAFVELFRAFRLARKLRRVTAIDSAPCKNSLLRSSQRLLQWLFVPLFSWTWVAGLNLNRLCLELLQEKVPRLELALYDLRTVFIELNFATLVAFTLYLSRWYIQNRVQALKP